MSDPVPLRLGTRGSRLALTQSRAMALALEAAHPGLAVEIVIIQTTGDKVLDSPLSRIGGKGVFTKEIEEALLDGRIDLAVHSLKDLPTRQPDGLALGAITRREEPRDLLIAAREVDLSLPLTIGTSSLRRRAQLRHRHPDLRIAELRGNVPTRVSRAIDGQYDAIVLAAAGIHRLELELPWHRLLTEDEMLPAPGQGSLGIQIRSGDPRTAALVCTLNDAASSAACRAERSLLQALGGGCQLPLGALATIQPDGLHLRGRVVSLEGDQSAEHELTGPVEAPEELGLRVAEVLLAQGAAEILGRLHLTPPEEGFDRAVAAAAAMDRGPLGGRTIVVTRDEDADGPLSLAIRARGGQPLVLPLVRHLPPLDPAPLHRSVQELAGGRYDWLLFTSSRAVEALRTAMAASGLTALPTATRVACVGESTAEAARDGGFPVSLVPADALATALAESLLNAGVGPGTRVLYPRADAAAETLRSTLTDAGAEVHDPIAYRTEGDASDADVLRLLGTQRVDAVLFCSPSAAESFARLAATTRERLASGALIGSIGPRTTAALSLVVHCEPKGDRSFDALAEALADHLKSV